MKRLIIDGKDVYEIDEECMRRKGLEIPEKKTEMLDNRNDDAYSRATKKRAENKRINK